MNPRSDIRIILVNVVKDGSDQLLYLNSTLIASADTAQKEDTSSILSIAESLSSFHSKEIERLEYTPTKVGDWYYDDISKFVHQYINSIDDGYVSFSMERRAHFLGNEYAEYRVSREKYQTALAQANGDIDDALIELRENGECDYIEFSEKISSKEIIQVHEFSVELITN